MLFKSSKPLFKVRTEIANVCQQMADKNGEPRSINRTDDECPLGLESDQIVPDFWGLRPINLTVSQPAMVHLFAKSLRVLFHSLASKSISTTCLLVEFNLLPNVFIERQKPLVLHL